METTFQKHLTQLFSKLFTTSQNFTTLFTRFYKKNKLYKTFFSKFYKILQHLTQEQHYNTRPNFPKLDKPFLQKKNVENYSLKIYLKKKKKKKNEKLIDNNIAIIILPLKNSN